MLQRQKLRPPGKCRQITELLTVQSENSIHGSMRRPQATHSDPREIRDDDRGERISHEL
jgi:hypothetical protein